MYFLRKIIIKKQNKQKVVCYKVIVSTSTLRVSTSMLTRRVGAGTKIYMWPYFGLYDVVFCLRNSWKPNIDLGEIVALENELLCIILISHQEYFKKKKKRVFFVGFHFRKQWSPVAWFRSNILCPSWLLCGIVLLASLVIFWDLK